MDVFEETIERALDALPEQFREILRSNEISVVARERAPGPVRSRYRRSVVFGMFFGLPYAERFSGPQIEPTRIELYKQSFEEWCGDEDEMREQIAMTVMHEVGHYFGFSEKEIRKLGY